MLSFLFRAKFLSSPRLAWARCILPEFDGQKLGSSSFVRGFAFLHLMVWLFPEFSASVCILCVIKLVLGFLLLELLLGGGQQAPSMDFEKRSALGPRSCTIFRSLPRSYSSFKNRFPRSLLIFTIVFDCLWTVPLRRGLRIFCLRLQFSLLPFGRAVLVSALTFRHDDMSISLLRHSVDCKIEHPRAPSFRKTLFDAATMCFKYHLNCIPY